MKKDTLYALLGLLLTSAGALLTLWLVFVSRNPDLFTNNKTTITPGWEQEEDWVIGEYDENLVPTSALLNSVTYIPENTEEMQQTDTAGDLYTGAGIIIDGEISEEIVQQNFYVSTLSEELKQQILEGLDQTAQYEELLKQQSYVHVLHYDFDGKVKTGELLVYSGIAQTVLEIFKELFEAKYPIEKIRLVSEYGWDDVASMKDNNTSAFNFRKIAGTNDWSKHALGMAIDINPLYNPYVYEQGSYVGVQPENAAAYVNRDTDCEYYIKAGDICYEAFVKRGFTWGGDWENPKDYQHFQVGKE